MVVHLSASDIKAPSLERAQRVSTPPLRAPSHVAIGGCFRVFNVSLALSNSAVEVILLREGPFQYLVENWSKSPP